MPVRQRAEETGARVLQTSERSPDSVRSFLPGERQLETSARLGKDQAHEMNDGHSPNQAGFGIWLARRFFDLDKISVLSFSHHL